MLGRITATAATMMICSAGLADGQYELVWSEEFEGFTLDTSVWDYMEGTGTDYGLPAGWGNNELQYYTDSFNNVRVSGGSLVITVRRETGNLAPFDGRQFTSGRLRTAGNISHQYGRVEASIKIPSNSGMWPAFWMLPEDRRYGGWASSGEIDIMESVNFADRSYGTLHYGDAWPQNQSRGGSILATQYFDNGELFGDDFHTYAIEWEPDQIRWYIDDRHFQTRISTEWWSAEALDNPRAPFDQPFHILLNVAVGGNFPQQNPSAGFTTDTMVVDYVRLYDRVQAPFNGAPAVVPGVIEAEDFDDGYDGMSYADADPQNNGGQYRATGVDIETATIGGFNIAYMEQDEWLEYTIDAPVAGEYQVEALVASQATGGSFRFERDGAPISATINVPVTGGWQTWQTVMSSVQLDAGVQTIRFQNLAGANDGYNVNRFTFTRDCPADIAAPMGTLDIADVVAFLQLFGASDPTADLATPMGTLDIADVVTFLQLFGAGCP